MHENKDEEYLILVLSCEVVLTYMDLDKKLEMC